MEEAPLEESTLQELPVKLEIFEGPLDLLLHLIRENKVEITDIPIAEITRQYLDFLEIMKALNLDVAGEFLVMAATLMHIKSRMLLPVEEGEEGEEEGEDPRQELVRQLQEYEKFKEAGATLMDLEADRRRIFAPRSVGPEEPPRTEFPLEVSLFELIGALKKLLEQMPEEERLEISGEQLTVAEKITTILDILSSSPGEVAFEDLFRGARERADVVVTFLALLELMKLRMVKALQAVPGGRIMVADIRPGNGGTGNSESGEGAEAAREEEKGGEA